MCVPVNISIDYNDNESNTTEQNEYSWENENNLSINGGDNYVR